MVIFCYKTIRKKSKMLDNNYRCGYDVGLLSIGLSGFEPRLEPNSIEFKYRFGWKKLLLCCNAELCIIWNRFYGLGRNACQVILKEDFPYFRVGNVHSDILRMYVESGFWMFSVWLIYYLIIMPKYIERKIGTKSSKFVMAVTLYTFIVI